MMVASEQVPLSETSRTPQNYQLGNADVKHNKNLNTIEMQLSNNVIGLTKEQLEQYRSDPFWKTLRTILFILFCSLWVCMFAAAFVIVILSPKCSAKKEPEWWRTKLSYQIFTPAFRDSDGDGIGDFKGVEEKLEDIRKIGVKSIWLSPVITTQKDDFLPYDIVDSIPDERFGNAKDFISLVENVHNRGMYIVIDLPIATTSKYHEWFTDAIKNGNFHDYYIWKSASEIELDDDFVVLNESDSKEKQAYLSYNGRDPVLNWNYKGMADIMKNFAIEYLSMGVDGFYLPYVHQLKRKDKIDPEQQKEALNALEEFISSLEGYINATESIGNKEIAFFTSVDDMKILQPNLTNSLTNLKYFIDDSITKLDEQKCADNIGKCIHNSLSKSLDRFQQSQLPYIWQFTNLHVSRLTSRFDVATGNLLTFIQLVLPGGIEIYYGQELGLTDTNRKKGGQTGLMQWDSSKFAGFSQTNDAPFFITTDDYKDVNYETQLNAERSMLKTFKIISKIRERDESLISAPMKLAPYSDDLIMFARVNHAEGAVIGSVYIVVANFGIKEHQANFTILVPSEKSSNQIEIVATTPNVENYSAKQKLDNSGKILLNAKQGILLKI